MGNWNVIFLGGGLASGLCTYRLKTLQPQAKVLIIEQGQMLGGNHTWSFRGADLTSLERAWIHPFVSKTWRNYGVYFSHFSRVFESSFHSIRSSDFHKILTQSCLSPDEFILGQPAQPLSDTQVQLSDGRVLKAPCVIDARGFPPLNPARVRYQKFVGLEVTLANDHGLELPIAMDARCDQVDGFRFLYVLPWTTRSLFIADTYYSDTETLNFPEVVARIQAYVRQQRWVISSINREEMGVIPIPLTSKYSVKEQSSKELASALRKIPAVGARAHLFHPTTGNSVHHAVRVADLIGNAKSLQPQTIRSLLQKYSQSLERNQQFCRVFNRMLFQAAQPEERFKVLQKFYMFPQGRIERFHSGKLKISDYLGVLSTRPPVPIRQALRCLRRPK